MDDFTGHINKQVKARKNKSTDGLPEKGALVRIQKLIAGRGLCSRRKAEQLVEQGRVMINGTPAQIGQKVDPLGESVLVNGKPLPIVSPKLVCLAVNKPRGFVCTNEDPYEKKTVFDLLPKEFAKTRLFCAGRLDKDSEGLVLLTNDGDLAQHLTHPSNQSVKIYQAELNKPLDPQHLNPLRRGKMVDGERLWLDKVVLLGRGERKPSRRLEIQLAHGRKREIRRILDALGYDVQRLKRIKVGAISIRKIPRGRYRKLSESEIDLLFSKKLRS